MASDREHVDFDFCYQIIPTPRSQEVTIFLKQTKIKVKQNEDWMNLSDRLVQQFGLPRGTLFRMFPVDGNTQRLGDDDHAYSFDWVEGQQYWFELVHDQEKDRQDRCREIRMVDGFGKDDSMVIPGAATICDVDKCRWI